MTSRALFIGVLLFIAAGIAFLFIGYGKITSLKKDRAGHDAKIKELRGDLTTLEADYDKMQRIRTELNQTQLTDLTKAELDYSRFVDMLREKKVFVEAAAAPHVVDSESKDLKTAFPIALAEVEVYEEISIKEVIDLMNLVTNDPHFVRLDVVEVGGGKARPSYKLTFHLMYGIDQSTVPAPKPQGPRPLLPPTPQAPVAGGRT